KNGEEKAIANRIYEILSNPTPPLKNEKPPAFQVGGEWELEMKFSASTVVQAFAFEQKENALSGTHYASFADRKLTGSINGPDILVRSSYTEQGVRLNFEFSGTVKGDSMEGKVSMGEYGQATWKAKRRVS